MALEAGAMGGARARFRGKGHPGATGGVGEYLFSHIPSGHPPLRAAGVGRSQLASLFLGLLTSHHVSLGHVEGWGVAVGVRGVFK